MEIHSHVPAYPYLTESKRSVGFVENPLKKAGLTELGTIKAQNGIIPEGIFWGDQALLNPEETRALAAPMDAERFSVSSFGEPRVYMLRSGDTPLFVFKRSLKPPHIKKNRQWSYNSALEEYTIAKDLYDHRTLRHEGVLATWEKPLGVLTLPEHNEGVVFAFIRGFQDGDSARVVRRIYKEGLVPATKLPIVEFTRARSAGYEGSYEQFLKVKAVFYFTSGEYLFNVSRLPYENEDTGGFGDVIFTIDPESDSQFTVHGMDVELYSRDRWYEEDGKAGRRRVLIRDLYEGGESLYRHSFGQGMSPDDCGVYHTFAQQLTERTDL